MASLLESDQIGKGTPLPEMAGDTAPTRFRTKKLPGRTIHFSAVPPNEVPGFEARLRDMLRGGIG